MIRASVLRFEWYYVLYLNVLKKDVKIIAVHVNDTSLNWKTRWNRDIPAGSNQCELWIFCFIASETDRKHSGLSILVASQWANSAPHYYNIDCCLKSVKTLLYKNCGVVLSMFQLMSFECFPVTVSPST